MLFMETFQFLFAYMLISQFIFKNLTKLVTSGFFPAIL